MASKRIDELTALAEQPASGDLLPLWDLSAAATKYVAVSDLVTPLNKGKSLYVDSVNGSDSTGVRERVDKPYLTLSAVETAAQSGDVINVGPGTYTVTDSILKTNVNWNIVVGGTISRADTTTEGIVDDEGSAINTTIVGNGIFTRSLPVFGASGIYTVVNTSHASSIILLYASKILTTHTVESVYTVRCQAGYLGIVADFIGREITTNRYTVGVWWDNGSMHIRANRIGVGGTSGNGIASVCTSTPTGDAYIVANEIYGPVSAIDNAGSDTTAAMWIRALVVRGTLSSGHGILIEGSNRLYVEAQKLFHRIRIQSGSGLNYIKLQKWSAIANGTTNAPSLLYQTAGTTTTIIEVQDVDTAGFTGNTLKVTGGGTVEIRGMRYIGNAQSEGIEISGGTLRLVNCHIDTSLNANTDPIIKSGGTLELVDCTLIAEGTRDSISAPTAQNVAVYGYMHSNKAVNANVTITSLASKYP